VNSLRISRFVGWAGALSLVLSMLPAAPLVGQLAPPYSLTAHADDANQLIQLTWGMNEDLPYVGFRIFRREAYPNDLWTQAHLTAANLVHESGNRSLKSWNDTGLPFDVVFNYTVCAVYDADGGVSQGQLCFCPGSDTSTGCPGRATQLQSDGFIPLGDRPTGGTATAIDHSRMRVRWQDNSSIEDGFVIQRWGGDAVTAHHPEIGRVDANQTEWIHRFLEPSTTYNYRVCAIPPGGSNSTVCSGPFSGTTERAPERPARPTSVRAEATSPTSIEIRWSLGFSGDTPTRFEIDGRVDGSTPYQVAHSLPPETRSFIHESLQPLQTWAYQVCAINAAGGSCADLVEATTPGLPALGVENLQAEASFANGRHRIVLRWEDRNGPRHGTIRTEVAKFSSVTSSFMTVEASEGAGAFARMQEWAEEGPSLQSDTGYRYRVCTRNIPESGSHRPCAEVAVRTADAGIDVGTMTLRGHLEELGKVDVRVMQPGGRTLLAAGETCRSCPWVVATRELGTTLQRAGVRGEVELSIVNARGALVAGLGRFPVARDGSIPGLVRDLQVEGREAIRTGEQCGFSLVVRDGGGQEIARSPFCLNRTGGRD